jgi:hypothetical protein
MTKGQKFIAIQGNSSQRAIDMINEFISSPKINALEISVDTTAGFIYLLYEELDG